MHEPKKILVPYDFSRFSAEALSHACQLAEMHESELHLLYVHSVAPFLISRYDKATEKMRQARLDLDRLLEPSVELKMTVRREVRRGLPHREIVNYAREHKIDQIVMSSHGRTGMEHLAVGSVAERVLRSSPCPVLVRPASDQSVRRGKDDDSDQADESLPFVADATSNAAPALDLIQRARSVRATDIHIDPSIDDEFTIRFRIDGHIEKYCSLEHDLAEHLMNQFQLMASLDIADPFRPKEGRLRLPTNMSDVEVRLTTCPVAGGEAMALRLFSRENVFHPLDQLGLSQRAGASVGEMLRAGEGVVLVTGPTGAGKTTTVYSMLEVLSTGERNIVSVEDPVEFSMPFVRQMAVDERHGITMSTGLRTLLRMDPDVVFVGEIRDTLAADIGMRAASSGKYVFSTLHTRDAASTVTALRDLHIDNRSLAANLTGIINQRLVRRLCSHCRILEPIASLQKESFQSHQLDPPEQIARARGCDECRGSGYLNRIGVFESVVVDQPISDAIALGVTEDELRKLFRSKNVLSLLADALTKVRDHTTSMDEALQVRWLT